MVIMAIMVIMEIMAIMAIMAIKAIIAIKAVLAITEIKAIMSLFTASGIPWKSRLFSIFLDSSENMNHSQFTVFIFTVQYLQITIKSDAGLYDAYTKGQIPKRQRHKMVKEILSNDLKPSISH